MKLVKTPLRYPGGKSRAIDNIAPLVPGDFREYREPFIGGASIYFYIRQKYIGKEYWINDLNYELYNFWKTSQENSGEIVKSALQWKNQFGDRGKDLFKFLKSNLGTFRYNNDNIKLASAYLALNQIVFSGCTLVGGFSESSFNTLTEHGIKELEEVGNILKGTKITNLDYQKVVEEKSKYNDDEVFIFCCLPGTKIRMKDEKLLNIEDINLGDITFLGGNVLNILDRNYNGYTYEFETMGIYDNLFITDEHLLSVIRYEKAYEYKNKHVSKFKHQDILNLLNIEFAKAKDIRIGDFLLIPCYNENVLDIQTVKIGDIDIKCDEELGWVIGFWIAEGHIDHYKGFSDENILRDIKIGKQRTIFDRFDIGEKFDIDNIIKKNKAESAYMLTLICGDLDIEYGFVDRFTKFMEYHFGKTGNIYKSGTSGSYRITYHVEEMARFLADKFGEGAENKKICNEILNYPIEFQKGLLRGWIDGDSGIWKDKNNRGKITGTTVSKQLASDMYLIALRLGLRPALKQRMKEGKRLLDIKTNKKEYYLNCDAIWDVYFSSSEDIIYLYSHIEIDFKERTKRKIITKGNKKFILSPITNILKREYCGKVYNLTTENHIYVANYVLNHNCDPPYYAATESGLYGKSDKLRNLHKMFDHYRFADTMKKCKYKWLVTYDDSEFIRKLFNWATIIPWNLTYGMRQYDNVGKELFISNYLDKVSESTQANICDIW